jgi:hypothetical protein
VKWTLRFLGFATLFSIPAFFLSGPWQKVLGRIASGVLSSFGIEVEMSEVEVMAPFDIGIYLAMCLASRRAPPLERRRAIEWGLIAMVLIEIATVVGAVLLFFALERRTGGEAAGTRLMQQVIEFVPWASAATVWLLLLGAWELPLPGGVADQPTPRNRRDVRSPRGS